MGKAKIIVGIAVVALAVVAGWQVVSCEVANAELQADLKDIASQTAMKIGLEAQSTEEELRKAVIHKAGGYGIELAPEQVTVQRTGSGKDSEIYLAADYSARVNLLLFSFNLHFTPSSKK